MTGRANVTVLSSLSIAQTARQCGLTVRAIRYYQERGLVELGRDRLGNRTFNQRAVRRLEFIALARCIGLSLTRVFEILTLGDTRGEDVRDSAMLVECRRRLAEIEHDREMIEDAVRTLSDRATPRSPRSNFVSA